MFANLERFECFLALHRYPAPFPQVVGLSLSQLAVLMLPADVANNASCNLAVLNGVCSATLPMQTLWYIVWITSATFVFIIIPFAIFYYEGDEDR